MDRSHPWPGAFWVVQSRSDNIQIVLIGDQTVITQALEKELIDAASLTASLAASSKKKDFVILVEHNQANIPYTGLGLLLKTAFARERPDALEGILKGFVESIAFISSPKNKPLVIKTIMNHLRIADPAVAEEGFQDAVTSTEKRPFPSVEGLRNIQRLLRSAIRNLPM